MAKDKAIQKLLERRRTAAVVPSDILAKLQSVHKGVLEELVAQKEYLTFLRGPNKITNAEYKVSAAINRVSDLRNSVVQLHFALREADLINSFVDKQKGKPENIAEAQQRISSLGELADSLAVDAEEEEAEEKKESATDTSSRSRVNLDLSLVTRLAGSGIRVGPMHFRLIAGQLERTYMNMVRITSDKEDTKKFLRGVKRFFLPPGKTLESVGIDARWLGARGFGQKEIESLLS